MVLYQLALHFPLGTIYAHHAEDIIKWSTDSQLSKDLKEFEVSGGFNGYLDFLKTMRIIPIDYDINSAIQPTDKAVLRFDVGGSVLIEQDYVLQIDDDLEVRINAESVPYLQPLQNRLKKTRRKVGELYEVMTSNGVLGFQSYIPEDLYEKLCNFDPHSSGIEFEARTKIERLNEILSTGKKIYTENRRLTTFKDVK